ncbi:MAG: DoxX family membrane protein [candidate division Zixibacteria bacterium]|nr:DoxX family membrane protein [candidate division Zixibacteria bacterium]
MKNILSNDYLTMLCRLAFGLIFIFAAIDKIAHPDQFARVVFNYHLVPGSLINLFALILPMSELIAGVCLITGVFYKGARNYLVFLMLIFIVAISVNIFRGINLECGCFSVSSKAKSHGLQLIYRDILMLLPGIVLLISQSRKWMLQKITG